MTSVGKERLRTGSLQHRNTNSLSSCKQSKILTQNKNDQIKVLATGMQGGMLRFINGQRLRLQNNDIL